MRFPIVLHATKGKTYSVIVPDLPGCYSAGDTFEEAMDMAREAIDAHVELLVSQGAVVPKGQPISRHLSKREYSGGIWAAVDVDLSDYLGKAEKINITMPSRLLKDVDAHAKAQGESRSGFLARAARQTLATDR